MLCKNSPFGRLNFLILSADADAKHCLKDTGREESEKINKNTIFKQNQPHLIIFYKQQIKAMDTYSLGCWAIARTDFLWLVSVTIVLPARIHHVKSI